MPSIKENWQSKLLAFLRREQFDAETDPLVRITLNHVAERGSGKSAAQVIEVRNAGKINPEDLTAQVVQAAIDDAEGLGGMQRYSVNAYRGEDGERKSGRFAFRIFIEHGEDELDADSEAADAKGLVSQSHRHVEAIMRLHVVGQEQTLRNLRSENESLRAQVERMSNKHFETLTLAEEMVQANHERRMDAIRADHEMTQRGEVFRTLKILLPTVVNKLAGKKLLPAHETPNDVIVDQFIESLDAAQVEQIQRVLKPQQLVAMAEVVTGAVERKESREKREKEARDSKTEEAPSNGKPQTF